MLFFVGTVSKKTVKTQNFIQFTQNMKIYQMCEKSFSIRDKTSNYFRVIHSSDEVTLHTTLKNKTLKEKSSGILMNLMVLKLCILVNSGYI